MDKEVSCNRMGRPFLILLVLVFFGCAERSDMTTYNKCWCADTLLVDSLKPKAPFDFSKRIVSYYFEDSTLCGSYPDSLNVLYNGQFNRKEIVQEIDITPYKLDLEKIFFNKIIKCEPSNSNRMLDSSSACIYFPHHCIVFYDKLNKPIDYFEVCFICDESRQSRDFGYLCGQTFCQLKELFKKAGHATLPLNLEKCK